MGVLKIINWNFFYFTFFEFNQYLYSITNFLFSYSCDTHIFINMFVTSVLITNVVFVFIFKLILSIMFLILIRGGTPRYRYDYLTKLGWLKFFGLTIFFFLMLLAIYCLL